MNVEKKINNQLLETLRNGDLSFLNSRSMNTVSELSNFARQIHSENLDVFIRKMISEGKLLTSQRLEVMELILKDKLSPLLLQWVVYEISKRDQNIPFFDSLQNISKEPSKSRNIFSSIENMLNNTEIDYVQTVETIATRYKEPIVQSHLALLHISSIFQ